MGRAGAASLDVIQVFVLNNLITLEVSTGRVRLGSNCTILLLQHIADFSLVKHKGKSHRGKQYIAPTMLYSLTPA